MMILIATKTYKSNIQKENARFKIELRTQSFNSSKKDIEAYKQKAEEIEIENSKRKQLKKIKTDEQNQEKFDLAFAQDKVTGDDDARNITRDMLINKGLVRKRKKIISKIRLKNKYKKAIHTMKVHILFITNRVVETMSETMMESMMEKKEELIRRLLGT